MGFKSNWNEATQGSSIKPEGDYECLIAKVEEREYNTTDSNGNEIVKNKLNISMIIRNDVEQGYKNEYIFNTLWKRREPTEADLQVKGLRLRSDYGSRQGSRTARRQGVRKP